MREIPIPFSGEMVRAILDGRKTMTRRVVKPGRLWPAGLPVLGASEIQPGYWQLRSYSGQAWDPDIETSAHVIGLPCPYGQPGDRLWVREAWRIGAWSERDEFAVDYRADGHCRREWLDCPDADMYTRLWQQSTEDAEAKFGRQDEYHWEPGESPCRWRRGRFMPRWASRLTLEVTVVRVERVQEITEADAVSEGCPNTVGYRVRGGPEKWFRTLWDRLNAGRGARWADTPWVWVVEFRRVQP